MSNTTAAKARPGDSTLERPEPIVRADALAYMVFERKDIAPMERFLQDFGFLPCGPSSGARRYFRTYGSFPCRKLPWRLRIVMRNSLMSPVICRRTARNECGITS